MLSRNRIFNIIADVLPAQSDKPIAMVYIRVRKKYSFSKFLFSRKF